VVVTQLYNCTNEKIDLKSFVFF